MRNCEMIDDGCFGAWFKSPSYGVKRVKKKADNNWHLKIPDSR